MNNEIGPRHAVVVLSDPLLFSYVARGFSAFGRTEVAPGNCATTPEPDEVPASCFLVVDVQLVGMTPTIARATLLSQGNEQPGDSIRRIAEAVDGYDDTTGSHCKRLHRWARPVGGAVGLGEHEVRILELAAYAHDIGKMAIPREILTKPAALTPEERRTIELHPDLGAILLQPFPEFEPVLPVVREHHERPDGSGYLAGLRGPDIHPLARIFQIMDVFDALIHERQYKPAWPLDKVCRYIRGERDSGRMDARMVDAVLPVLAEAA